MKVSSHRVLDHLAAEEQCLGALFTSYGFDPAYFEEQVLRAVLRLTSDPFEQAERYHQEARRALQETPVVAIVDASERMPGRRLPFDLLEVAKVVFHPKSVLLLYREHARLLIGSGNLTRPGYCDNTELFLCLDLEYADAADAALLIAYGGHLGRVRDIVRSTGKQLDQFLKTLHSRLPEDSPDLDAVPSYALLDSMSAPIIEQLVDLLPEQAVVESLGLLAPYYERDDGNDLDSESVFRALAPHMAKDAVLDVGVSWENPRVQADGDSKLEDGLGRLWTWEKEREGVTVLEHLVPREIGPNSLSYTDEAGIGRRCPLKDAREDIKERWLWMPPRPWRTPHDTRWRERVRCSPRCGCGCIPPCDFSKAKP